MRVSVVAALVAMVALGGCISDEGRRRFLADGDAVEVDAPDTVEPDTALEPDTDTAVAPDTTPPDDTTIVPDTTPPSDKTPVDTTPEDTTPTDTTPTDTTPEDTTPVDTTPTDTTPEDTTPVDTTPEDTTPVDTTPVDTTPEDTTPVDTTPVDTTPVDTTPEDTTPVDTTPVDTTPVDTTPEDTTPVDTTPADTTPVDTTPVDTTPEDTTPADTGDSVAIDVIREPDFELLHELLDAYMDARLTPTAGDTANLVATIRSENADITDLEVLLLSGRSSYPDVSDTLGVVTERTVDCEHVDYRGSYFLAVPPDYESTTPAPVVIVTYPANELEEVANARADAFAALEEWRATLWSYGAIVVAPVTTRGWSPIADSLVFTMLSELQRRYRVDLGAIYVVGRGSGGHMVWRSAFNYDRYAAFAPIGGGYNTWVANNTLRNLYGMRGYQAWSSDNSSVTIAINVAIADWLDRVGFTWERSVYASDDLRPTPELMDDIAAFFHLSFRDPWRGGIYMFSGGTMVYDTNWPSHSETIYSDRAYRWNMRGWLEVSPPGLGEVMDLFGEVKDDHTIALTADNVRQVRVWVHPSMGIDMGRPLRVYANDVLVYEGEIAEDMEAMLELVREFDDPMRLYRGYVDVQISNDRPVPEPFGSP